MSGDREAALDDEGWYANITPGHAPMWQGEPAVAVGQKAAVVYTGTDEIAWFGRVASHLHRTSDDVFIGNTYLLCEGSGEGKGSERLIHKEWLVRTDTVHPL